MSVKTYLTVRPLLQGGEWVTPNQLLAHSFAGMDVRFTPLLWSPLQDGRMLLEIVTDTDAEMDAVVEALAWFGRHQKTLGSAKAFADALTGRTWALTGDAAAERCDPDAGEGVAPPPPTP